MLIFSRRSIFILIIVSTLCMCIDPYSPKLSAYGSLLVVDGLLTDGVSGNRIRLSRTFQEQNLIPEKVTDAIVTITDDAGTVTTLINKGNGMYIIDSTTFVAAVGRRYILHIITSDNNEYLSSPCMMYAVPDIDRVYFGKDQRISDNGSSVDAGVSVYLDSKEGDSYQFYRWSFEETWKFKVPYPKKYYFNMADSLVYPLADVKDYCWKNAISDDIIIHPVYNGENPVISKEHINFISSTRSDRLLVGYSILVNQYSLSKEEFKYWNLLKQVNEGGSDIFARQPFSAQGNIHNVNKPEERVLGYFQVSARKQKRAFFSFSEYVAMDLPNYNYPCMPFLESPENCFTCIETWPELYVKWCITSKYDFCEPQYIPGTTTWQKFLFTTKECAECDLTGTRTKPDFWIDTN